MLQVFLQLMVIKNFQTQCFCVTVAAVGDAGDNMVYIKPNTITRTGFNYLSYGVWATTIIPEAMTWFAVGN